MRLVLKVMRYLLAGIFIIAGLLKLSRIDFFSIALLQYGLSLNYAQMLAVAISLFEISLGSFLIMGIARKIVTAISLFTFITFTFIAFYDFYAGNSISCGCFGGIQFLETSPFSRIIYNFLFVLFSLTSVCPEIPVFLKKIEVE
jgi:uncharacterized membrane protein YphA (DoxX/SURF4 family)